MGGHIGGGGQLVIHLLDGVTGGDDRAVLLHVCFLDLGLHGAPDSTHCVIPWQSGLLGVLLADLKVLVPGGVIATEHRRDLIAACRQSGLFEQIGTVAHGGRPNIVACANQLAAVGLAAFRLPIQPVIVLNVITQVHEGIRHGENRRHPRNVCGVNIVCVGS